MPAQFTVGAFALIFNDKGRVLLAHRTDKDLWNLPGGGLEDLEAPWKAIVREVKEETGLIVEVIKLTGIYSKASKNDIVFCFFCKTTGGQLTLNDEASALEFFDVHNLPKNIPPKQVERILDYVKSPETVHQKIQTGQNTHDMFKN